MDNKAIWESKWLALAEYSKRSAGNRWAFYLIEYLLNQITIENGCIVDVGCGMGNKTSVLAKRYPSQNVYGIDFTEEGIKQAEKIYANQKNLHFIRGDATAFRAPNENIELITCFEVLEHLEDWGGILEKLCNMTKKYIMISVPTGRMREYEKDLGHFRNFKKGEIEEFMKKQNFKKIDVLYAGFPFWSPITRDFLNKEGSKADDTLISFHSTVHQIMYVMYKYLSFKRIGDQFIGIFEK